MKKNNVIALYVVNILTAIIEFLIVSAVTYLITNNIVRSLFFGGIWMSLGIFCYALFSTNTRNKLICDASEDYHNETFEKIFEEIKQSASKHLKKDVEIVYSRCLPNPAGAISDEVIIVNPDFLKSNANLKLSRGVIAHEFGHIISGMINHSPITLVHFGAVFQYLYYLALFLNISVKNSIMRNVLITIVLIFAVPLNITNYISIFYYYRKDEYIANANAALLGGGEELRTFYAQSVQPKLLLFTDVKHPSVLKMNNKLNHDMHKNDFEKHIYLSDNIVTYVDTKALNMSYQEAAFKYYRHHKNDSDEMMMTYANCYYYGSGVEKDLDKAISLYKNVNNLNSKVNIAVCYAEKGDYNKAVTILTEIDFPRAKFMLSKYLIRLERYQEAYNTLVELKGEYKASECNGMLRSIEKYIIKEGEKDVAE